MSSFQQRIDVGWPRYERSAGFPKNSQRSDNQHIADWRIHNCQHVAGIGRRRFRDFGKPASIELIDGSVSIAGPDFAMDNCGREFGHRVRWPRLLRHMSMAKSGPAIETDPSM